MINAEVPMYLELQFDVHVGISIGLRKLGASAPFIKKCGLNLVGVLVNTGRRLGPLLCRDSFAQLDEELPLIGRVAHSSKGGSSSSSSSPSGGVMSFSAAQMDPERVMLGERLKNISIIGIGSLCFFFGFWFTFLESSPCDALEAYSQAGAQAYVAGRVQSALSHAAKVIPSLPGRRSPEPSPTADSHPGIAGAASSYRTLMSLVSCGCVRGGAALPAAAHAPQAPPAAGPSSHWHGYFPRVLSVAEGREAAKQANSRDGGSSSRLLGVF